MKLYHSSPTFDYEDDFDSETPHEAASSSSSNSITPTTSLKDDDLKHSNVSDDVVAAAYPSTSKDRKGLLCSSEAEDKALPYKSTLLTRSNNKQSLLHSEAQITTNHLTAGLHSSTSAEFKLSPIHAPQTGLAITSKSFVSEASSSALSSESTSSVREAKGGVTLTPLHAKQLTANESFNTSPTKINKPATEGKKLQHTTTTLSPLHATGSGVVKQSTNELSSSERKLLTKGNGQNIGLSPVHAGSNKSSSQGKLFKVQEEIDHSSPTHEHTDLSLTTDILLQQKFDSKLVSPPLISQDSTLTRDNLKAVSDQTQTSGDPVEMKNKPKYERDGLVAATTEPLGAEENGLGEDLAELQSALQAAGLPPMRVSGEREQKEEESSVEDHPSINVSVKKPYSSPSDNDASPLANFKIDHSKSAAAAHSRVPVSPKQADQGVAGVDLREAIRVIASEELASISKEILKQEKRGSLSKQPLLLERDAQLGATHLEHGHDDRMSDQGAESSPPKDSHKLSRDIYEGLEVYRDLSTDVEGKEARELKKPSPSNTKKVPSVVPKVNSKAPSSKKGPAAKVDSRLTSKIKTGVPPASAKLSSTKKHSIKDTKSASRPAVLTKVNRTPSTVATGSWAKPKILSQTSSQTATSPSAPLKQLNSRRTNLKTVGRSAAKSAQPIRREIVIPTGSSIGTVDSPDSESENNEGIHVSHENGKKMEDRLEIKMDAWKKALQEEKVSTTIHVYS